MSHLVIALSLGRTQSTSRRGDAPIITVMASTWPDSLEQVDIQSQVHTVTYYVYIKNMYSHVIRVPIFPVIVSESPLSADLWVLNSCTVKGPSEDGLKNSIRKGRELGKPLVITGCVPQGQRNHGDVEGLSVVGVSDLHTLYKNIYL